MCEIRDWLKDFMRRYRLLHNPNDWPEPGTMEDKDFAISWLEAFEDAGATQAQAETAMRRLLRNPPQWRRDHLPALLREIHAVRVASIAVPIGDDRETAANDPKTRSCDLCGGSGLAVVFHPQYDGAPKAEYVDHFGESKLGPSTAPAHCICPLGRWIRGKLEEKLRSRFVDLKEVMDGRSTWQVRDKAAEKFMGEFGQMRDTTEMMGFVRWLHEQGNIERAERRKNPPRRGEVTTIGDVFGH